MIVVIELILCVVFNLSCSRMVRFKVNYGAHIAKNLAYLDYDRLKVILHEQEGETTVKGLINRHHRKDPHQDFSTVFFEEIERIDRCYRQHMLELDFTLADMQKLAKDYLANKKTREKWQRKAQEAALKRSATHLHNKITKLETFRLLNRTAAIKILKKHDKLAKDTGEESFLEPYMIRVGQTNFGDGTKLSLMKEQLEEQYADVFCHGVLEEAQGKLRLAKTNTSPEILLGVAFKVGIIITLLAWLAYNFAVAPKLSLLYVTNSDPSVYVYAGVGALITYRWFWGFSVYMWDSVDIDYIFILDLDAIKLMPSSELIFSETGTLTIAYLLNVIIFHSMRYQSAHKSNTADPSADSLAGFISDLSAHAYIMPLLLVVGAIVRVGSSVMEHRSSGVFSYKVFKTLLRVPFSTVHLRFTYAADILTSLNRVFVHFIFSGCYFTTGAFLYASDPRNEHAEALFTACTTHPALYTFKVFIQIFPYYIRMMQCLRQRRDHFLRQELLPPVVLIKETPLETIQEEDGAAMDDAAEDEEPKMHSRPSYVSLPDLGGQEDTTITSTSPSKKASNTNTTSGANVNADEDNDEYAVCYLEDRDQFNEYYDHDEDPLGHSSHFDPDNIEYEDHDHSPLALPIRQSPSKTRLRALSQGSNRSGGGSDRGDFENQRAPSPGNSPSAKGSYLPQRKASVGRNNRFPRATRAQIDRFLGEGRTKSHDFASFMSMVYATIMVWPYSYNALRYFLSILVIFFGAFPPSDTDGVLYRSWYIPLYVIATLFSCYWDVAMDFQLMQFNCKKPFLRSRLFYEETEIFYYVVLVLNPILRFMWTLNFTPFGGQAFLVIFEIARRSMWACLRMELGYIQELERRK